MTDTFLELYDRYFDDVYRFVYYKTGNKWDADDLVSETFRKAYEHFSSAASPNGKGWLITIARNTVIDFYRKKKEVPSDYRWDTLLVANSFTEAFEQMEDMACFRKSMAVLSEKDRELINLKYIAEMKYKEVAKIFGETEEAIKSRTYRLFKKLAVLITKCMEGVRAHE